MGFGTEQQLGNRQTNLADIFRGNIGAPQQIGATQQPNQLFELLQRLIGGSDQGGGDAGQIGLPQQPGGTPLSAVTAEPIGGGFQRGGGGFGGGTLDVQPQGSQLSNPFGSLINQRFIR